MKKSFFWILLVILFSTPTVIALLHPGFFQSDDGEWMVIRFSAFHQALRDGQLPVRFLSRLNYGYGYPVANFLYPGFMYFGEIFKLLGFGFVSTIKIILGLSMVGSAIFTYLWLSKLFSKWASFVGSILYLYAPYHLFDLYKRGSVGEILALCVAPFVFWQIERRSFLWTSLGVALLVLSHNSLSLLFLSLILLYLVTRSLASVVYFLPSIALGLGLSAFFWVPAIFDLQYTFFHQTQVSEWGNYFAPFGIIGILPILVLVWYFLKSRSEDNKTSKLMFFGAILFLFLGLPISSFIWSFLPVSFIQFPFRLLSVVILQISFLVAFLLDKVRGSKGFVLGLIFLAICLISAFSYLTPREVFDKGDSYYATNEGTTTVKNEYMPKWVKNSLTEHAQEKVEIVNGQITDLETKSNKISFLTNSIMPSKVIINTIYFPGWNVVIDGKRSLIDYENNGLIQIEVPQGQHNVIASFAETPIRLLSDTISLLSLFALLIITIITKSKFLLKL